MRPVNKKNENQQKEATTCSIHYLKSSAIPTFYRYAESHGEPVTNESAVQIGRLCMSDPFFISCVIGSDYEGKELTTEEGVVDTVHHEIANRKSEMQMTWGEYIELSLRRINTVNSKHILLHLSRHPEREWTPRELREELGLEISEREIGSLLRNMVRADLICEGGSDIRYRGLTDGTLCLILRSRFEEEIATCQPDGRNMEMDVLAESGCGRVLAVEVKKTKAPTGPAVTEDFMEKIGIYAALHPEKQMLPAFFSTGGFTHNALEFCRENGIATAREISVF